MFSPFAKPSVFAALLGALLSTGAWAQEAAPAPAADPTPAAEPAPAEPKADAPVAAPCPDGEDKMLEGVVSSARTSLGSELKLGLSGVTCGVGAKASDEVFALFDRVEKLTDDDDEGSSVKRINDAAGAEAVVVDAELFALIQLAIGFAQHTEGAFDPTFAALAGLWTFREGEVQIPDQAEIDRRRALVDWTQVELDESKRTVRLGKEGMKLGLGGIVKGYTMDKAVSILRKHGVKNFILRSGGELYVSGNPGGGYRRVGIPDPRSDRNYALVDVRDRALNTSSDNDAFFIEGGVRYHHIIDPKSGRPAGRARSVSVISVDATSADALSTAIFVMGPKAGMALVEQLAGVEAILVDSENQVHISSGLSERLVVGAPTDRRP
jgi:thiamine biosynthesis lipoprotein